MAVDRIERHDVLNAMMLAGVLLLLGFGILTAFDSFTSTVDEGIIESTKEPEPEAALGDTDADTDVDAEEEDPEAAEDDEASDETSALINARPAGEVTVRIGNGARRPGVAGAGTSAVEDAGYPTLDPKNGPTLDDSVVYYVSGYAADAAAVAEVLGLEPTQIEPMPSDPGVPIEGAHVIAILGVNSEF